jgi:hypothetical protein
VPRCSDPKNVDYWLPEMSGESESSEEEEDSPSEDEVELKNSPTLVTKTLPDIE